MISEAEAIQRVLTTIRPGPVEQVPLEVALDRFSADDLLAQVPVPSFDNSSMDGFAICAADSRGAAPIRVVGEQPAGLNRHLRVGPGCAVRVFTGAPLPAGADAVIMQEDAELLVAEGMSCIRCREPVSEGENVRRAGADLCRGQKMVERGARLGPARIGLLASQGLGEAAVHAFPRVAMLSTGDELVRPGGSLGEGQIYNSNGPMLQAMLRRLGIRAATLASCSDEFDDTVQMLSELAGGHDFILLSGGVSVGDRDQVRPALAHLGLTPDVWRVRIKPGKPFLFAHGLQPEPLHVFGLPGNPVSSFVTFLVLVRPALLKWMGASEGEIVPPTAVAASAASIANPGDRPHYVRGRLESSQFVPLGLQQSHALFGLSQANALLRLEPGEAVERGDLRQVMVC